LKEFPHPETDCMHGKQMQFEHCTQLSCPLMTSSVMDYAFNDRDLRVKKDVSDLKLDPLFWRRVLGKNDFFASYRIHPSAAVRQVCGALSRQLQGQSVFVLGSVFVHGLCAINLSRESARHRRLSSRALRSTLSSGLPQPCLSQYIGRCQRSALSWPERHRRTRHLHPGRLPPRVIQASSHGT